MINWTAVCRFPGRAHFLFYSSAFTVDHWSELEKVAQRIVSAEWARIAPGEPPEVTEYFPGNHSLALVSEADG